MAAASLDSYSTLFGSLVERSIQATLTRLQAQGNASIAEAERTLTLYVLDYALSLEDIWPATSTLVLAAAPQMEHAGYWNDWLPLLERALQLSQQQEDQVAQAEIYFQRGVLQQLRTKLDAAYKDFACSAELFRVWGDNAKTARAQNRQAYVARLQQNYATAQALIHEATDLLAPSEPEQAYSSFVRGVIAFDQRDWPQAEHWLRQSLAQWDQHGSKRMFAYSLCNLGPVLQVQQRYDEALSCYREAEKLLIELGDRVQLALTHMNIGIVYTLTDQYEVALPLFREAESIFRSVQATLYLAQLYNNLGICYRRSQQWTEAQSAYEQSIALYRELKNFQRMANAMDGLGQSLLELGMIDRAVAIFEEGLAILASAPDDPGSERVRSGLAQRLATAHAQKEPLPANPGATEAS